MSDFFDIDISGAVGTLQRAAGALPGGRARGMRAIMLQAEGAVKDRFCPWKDGELAGSVTGTVEDGGEVGELRTNNIVYAAAQEFDHEYDHPNQGPTGERGADYIGRGIRYADEVAPEVWQQMHEEAWSG